LDAIDDLPADWTGTDPTPADVPALHTLLLDHERAARGSCSAALATVDSDVAGPGALSRRHLLVRDPSSRLRGWATVHDRAAGRSLVSVIVDPALEDDLADTVAGALLGWTRREVAELATRRGLGSSQADSGAFVDDARQQRWLAAAGFEHTRSWWQMSRPVDPAEAFPEPGPGVLLRSVARDPHTGMPVESDLAAVHDVLEASFKDHFNYREETFDEFVSRLREDPGHRWDHWWIAELVPADGGPAVPAGALVGAVSSGAEGGPDSSYVEYLGVLRLARGLGVASSLLHAVFADAALRDRPSVGIEVDKDSSTGAARLYVGLGFVTGYTTQSWHLEVAAA
jgi:ribosomal protein S18 acetylase RimI-like enzyme